MLTVYSKPKCMQCEMTKMWLTQNKIPFEPVEDVIKKFEESGQKMKSFQCYTNDKDIERYINGGY